MTDVPHKEYGHLPNGFPDRLSIDGASPYFCKVSLLKQPEIYFNGVKQSKVAEYCVSEGWVRRAVGNKKAGPNGKKVLAFKSFGVVEVRPHGQ